MQFKAMRFCHSPARIAKITTKNIGENMALAGSKMVQPHWRRSASSF